MKATILVKKEIEIKSVIISLPVRYDDEDMPFDFPFRKEDSWQVIVDIDTGQIKDWPENTGAFTLNMKVVDEGHYHLLNEMGESVLKLEEEYVPHGVVPGSYGDYVELEIDENGIITNWPKVPNIEDFQIQEED